MNAVKSILRPRWIFGFLGVGSAASIIWLIGPLLGIEALSSIWLRVAMIGIMLLGALAATAWSLLRDRKRNKDLVEGLEAEARSDDKGEEDLKDIKEQLQNALATLKKSAFAADGAKGRKRYLYQLPWYMVIGPPGSGKTTALKHSGLRFPLNRDDPRVKGIAGTRNCDWWFTNDAVLIDTAGRYTTQDSNQTADSGAWQGFLRLLKTHRPRQPLNGLMVMISLHDIANMSNDDLLGHAATIRDRIEEIQEKLTQQLPVYVIFTMADLIHGFRDFFSRLSKEEIGQVWGMTRSLDSDVAPASWFAGEFDLLVSRLNNRLFEALSQEEDLHVRSSLFSFPNQFQSFKAPVSTFLEQVFQQSRFSTQPKFRGVYFTSAIQIGAPIDRLMRAMATGFGVPFQESRSTQSSGRSYFLTDLLQSVVFAEAGLGRTDPSWNRRRKIGRYVAYATAVTLVLGLGGYWTGAFLTQRQAIAQTMESLPRYSEKLADIELSNVSDRNAARLLPALNTLREEAHLDTPAALLPDAISLDQTSNLDTVARQAYRDALQTLLLPRILLGLEDQIRGHMREPAFIYEALKVYLILGNKGPKNPDLIHNWMDITWTAQFGRATGDRTVPDLLAHLDSLLEIPQLHTYSLDGNLVEQSRVVLSRMPAGQRAYQFLRADNRAQSLPQWTAAGNVGRTTTSLFTRTSGTSLATGIPGLFTPAGYRQVYVPLREGAASAAGEEIWVLDNQQADATRSLPQIIAEMDRLYARDYITAWDTFLNDLAMVPFTDLSQANQLLNFASAQDSPILAMIREVAKNTRFDPGPAPANGPAPPDGSAPGAAGMSNGPGSDAARLNQLMTPSSAGFTRGAGSSELPPELRAIEDHFAPIHRLVGNGEDPTSSPLSMLQSDLDALYRDVTQFTSENGGGNPTAFAPGSTNRLRLTASRLPHPVQDWISTLIDNTAAIGAGSVRETLSETWRSTVYQSCREALHGRYPFDRSSQSDAQLRDIATILGPGGSIEIFFNTYLRPFVDTTTRPWRWKGLQGAPLGINQGVLVQFERAEEIRRALFGAGSQTPSFGFELRPLSLDPSAFRSIIDVEGQALEFAHSQSMGARMQWPGPQTGRGVSLTIIGQDGSSPSLRTEGPWALFRLMDKGQVRHLGAESLQVAIAVNGRQMIYQLRADSVFNPFSLPELRHFACPSSL